MSYGIRFKVSACGVCHSNLHMVEGDWLDMGVPAKLPIVPGHEVTGTVCEVGNEVKNIVASSFGTLVNTIDSGLMAVSKTWDVTTFQNLN